MIFCFDDLPNELCLIVFSYLKKYQLIQSFYQINQRMNLLLLKYFSHIYLTNQLTRKQIEQYRNVNTLIRSLTIDDQQIGRDFLEKNSLKNLFEIKLIDSAIELENEIVEKYQPEIVNLVYTSFYQEKQQIKIQLNHLEKVKFEFYSGELAKKYFDEQSPIFGLSCLMEIRLVFSKLSEYFQLFNSSLNIRIEKVYISIFSIDEIDLNNSKIILPYLNDFQLEICSIPFEMLHCLLPNNYQQNFSLKRLAFIGQTTTINAKLWQCLLKKYSSIEQFHLFLTNIKSINHSDIQQWKIVFPQYTFHLNSTTHSFEIYRSKFDCLERILINESITNLEHIEYLNKITHLIIRSEYWCSYIDLRNDLLQRFSSIKRLSTTMKQLELINDHKFLSQIEQLDLEFSEKFCYINNNLIDKLIHLKSLCLTSIYDGIHQIYLHSVIKHILFNQFPQLNYLSIDSIEIIDEEQVEQVVSQWYSANVNIPMIKYIQGRILSIWF